MKVNRVRRRIVACLVVIAAASLLGGAGPAAGSIGYDATHTQTIDAGRSLVDVSCVPGTTTCVAANSQGNALYATDVSANSAATWRSWSGPESPGYAVECPTSTLCLLAAGTIGGGGKIYRATSLGGAFQYLFSPNFGANAISCSSASFCATAQGNGWMRFSASPSTNDTWLITAPGGGELEDVSCLSSSFCVEVGSQGSVHVATEELTEDYVWTSTNVNGSIGLRGVACTSTTSCVAVDGSDEVLNLTIDAGGAATASQQTIDGADGLVAVACTGTTCAAADDHGGIFASMNAGVDWIQRYGGGAALTSVSCASASLCAAVTTTGDVTTFDPASTVPPLVLTSRPLPAGAADAPYEADVVQAGGGTPPYQWSATGLPPGLSIDQASGQISGTPMTAVCAGTPCPQPSATYRPTVTVTDDHGVQASSLLTLALAARISALTVTTTGGGSGGVSSSPVGINGCGMPTGACEASYDEGTVVTLTATPAAGSEFAGWSGGCSGTGACQVTIGAVATLTARFEVPQPPVVPQPLVIPQPPASPLALAQLQIKQFRARSVRTRCAAGSASVTRSRRRACAKVTITVGGTIAKEASGTVSVKVGVRVQGRQVTVTKRARILSGRWSARFMFTGIDRVRNATITTSFAGSPGVQGGHAERRVERQRT